MYLHIYYSIHMYSNFLNHNRTIFSGYVYVFGYFILFSVLLIFILSIENSLIYVQQHIYHTSTQVPHSIMSLNQEKYFFLKSF